MHGREHLVAVVPVGKGLVLEVIRYSDELRDASRYFAGLDKVKYDPDLLELAAQLVSRQAKPFKPEQFKDSYAVELRALLQKKAKGQKIEVPQITAPPQGNVVNIMEALKKSLKAEAAASQRTAKATPKPASKRA